MDELRIFVVQHAISVGKKQTEELLKSYTAKVTKD